MDIVPLVTDIYNSLNESSKSLPSDDRHSVDGQSGNDTGSFSPCNWPTALLEITVPKLSFINV